MEDKMIQFQLRFYHTIIDLILSIRSKHTMQFFFLILITNNSEIQEKWSYALWH